MMPNFETTGVSVQLPDVGMWLHGCSLWLTKMLSVSDMASPSSGSASRAGQRCRRVGMTACQIECASARREGIGSIA